MLVGGKRFGHRRVAFLLAATVLFCLPALVWYMAARKSWVAWPSGSTAIGFECGIAAGAIVFFEMLLGLRKKLRRHRLGAARLWMFLHIWLGLLSLPLAICHSGFALGGSLSAAVMILFLLVIASGVFGLAMQQIVPRLLLENIATETIVSEAGFVMEQYLVEARALVDNLRTGHEISHTRHTLVGSDVSASQGQLMSFFHDRVVPYLLSGRALRSPLASIGRSKQLFAELRRGASDHQASVVNRLEAICDIRRQLDLQARWHWWLHSWLSVHLPLSIALFVLLVAHIVFALKFW